MNTANEEWSAEQIHAFVDGALPPAQAEQLRARLRDDAALAMRVARQQALRAQLARAFDPVLDEAVPARLLQALEGRTTAATPIGAARTARAGTRPQPLWWGAAAASVLLSAIIGWSLPRGMQGDFEQRDGALLAAGGLAEALSTRLSASETVAGVAIPFSIRAEDGRYCRAFALPAGMDGLACRTSRGWEIEATGRSDATGAAAGDAYRQAASSLSPSVLAVISAQQAGDALTSEEERRVRDTEWN
jgi:hypothetical protein